MLLDYDGTLTPIVAHPALARLARDTRLLLRRFNATPGIEVGIVSSRGLDDLRRMVRVRGICLAGNCGLEMRVGRQTTVHPRGSEAIGPIADFREQLALALSSFEGAWLEDKRYSLTVHYRHLATDRTRSLSDQVHAMACDWPQPLQIVPGPMALEITPDINWTKANCVQRLMVEFAVQGPDVFYAGNAANDAEALELVRQMRGIAVGIGPQSPDTAEYRLPDPAALVTLLIQFSKALAVKTTFAAAPQD